MYNYCALWYLKSIYYISFTCIASFFTLRIFFSLVCSPATSIQPNNLAILQASPLYILSMTFRRLLSSQNPITQATIFLQLRIFIDRVQHFEPKDHLPIVSQPCLQCPPFEFVFHGCHEFLVVECLALNHATEDWHALFEGKRIPCLTEGSEILLSALGENGWKVHCDIWAEVLRFVVFSKLEKLLWLERKEDGGERQL